MEYFQKYTSNTCAGSGNQLLFTLNKGQVRTGRVFYRIAVGGAYHYSILFSNTVDSTFADGSACRRNLPGGEWEILEAKLGRCPGDAVGEDFWEPDPADQINGGVSGFRRLTFAGKEGKRVAPGELFHSDPVLMGFEAGEYLCLEITFSGGTIPCHEESLLPVYIKEGAHWRYCKQTPVASMVGCDRTVRARIGFLGDSITQGIGAGLNTYQHWNAVLSQMLGEAYACWNLGLGYGRADDMATDGAWLYKAKQNDMVIVCCGVNDIEQGLPEALIKEDLERIVDALLAAGATVVLQTVPPFDYTGEKITKWNGINDHIRGPLARKAALVFDVVPYLGQDEAMAHMAKFGGHPDGEGCAIWARALYDALKTSGLIER